MQARFVVQSWPSCQLVAEYRTPHKGMRKYKWLELKGPQRKHFVIYAFFAFIAFMALGAAAAAFAAFFMLIAGGLEKDFGGCKCHSRQASSNQTKQQVMLSNA